MSDAPVKSNVPEMSVSELSFSLKRTLEETYGRVRVRGELSAVKIPGSGHMYSDLKDDSSVINIICWKGTLSKLSVRPEEGLEVICTGRITTYPARSNYQLIIDSMELAGQGALLKMLEERRKKLAAEGLFDAGRKRKLPYLPEVIGVITSPTGAVIKDILHRLADRFPRHVLVWPVAVQGEDAAAQVTAAVSGFNRIQPGGKVPRPDLLIVARGGGSLEDLMPFNDEALVRAVAGSAIPVISAIGHETDTTLIDYAADMRAPTPTAAAEMSVPVRLEILGWVQEQGQRMFAAALRRAEEKKARLETLAAKLGDPERLLELRRQKLDLTGRGLSAAFEKRISTAKTASAQAGARLRDPMWLLHKKQEALIFQLHRLGKSAERLAENRSSKISALSGRLRPPQALVQQGRERLDARLRALMRASAHIVPPREKELEKSAKLLNALSYQKVLERGFAVVTNEAGHVVTDAGQLKTGESIEIRLHKGRKEAVVSEDKASK